MCVIYSLHDGLVNLCTGQSIAFEDELDYPEHVRPQVCNASDE